MNKKIIFIIPVGLLFFIMLIYTSSGYDESLFLFVLRHVLIFALMGYLIVLGQIIIKNTRIILKNKNRKLRFCL